MRLQMSSYIFNALVINAISCKGASITQTPYKICMLLDLQRHTYCKLAVIIANLCRVNLNMLSKRENFNCKYYQ